MEALKLKRKSDRAQLTHFINEEEATLTHESVTEEELCLLNDRINRLHTDLRPTGFDIIPLLSFTEEETEFDRIAQMQRLIDMRPVQSSKDLRGLRCLYDMVQTQTQSLKTLRVSEDSYSAIFYPILLKSLPHHIVLDANAQTTQDSPP
ncbi:hypothetical protein HPB51_003992 [Rhipicephalus microplus]|uniref:Uncharacterized protein n=1 Tax=Rhipicephalus microplus TaxID=6941 RepID=A0A9J6DT64_RHIMP|nr:hypothetical protein HPB51_003992 [Rhipicephalus microplus]